MNMDVAPWLRSSVAPLGVDYVCDCLFFIVFYSYTK